MTQLTEQNARQIFADVNTRNVDKIVEHYAENATFQVPNLDAPVVGKEAIRTYVTSALTAFPDWSMDVREVLVSGHEAVVRDHALAPARRGRHGLAVNNRANPP